MVDMTFQISREKKDYLDGEEVTNLGKIADTVFTPNIKIHSI